MLGFIAASPTPYHACRRAAARLDESGFQPAGLDGEWPLGSRWYVIQGGTLVALLVPQDSAPDGGCLVIGAHTDSPNLRVRPHPDLSQAGYRQLAVEMYGKPLLNSWLDRDLGVAGRAVIEGADGPETRHFDVSRPLARVPQLAVHLDSEVNDKGVRLNRQTQLLPVWGLDESTSSGFAEFLASELGVEPQAVLSWDAMLHPLEAPAVAGREGEFISAPRLDNLLSSYCGLSALIELSASGTARKPVVLALFDHEEIGSVSATGAAGQLLPRVLERLSLAIGGGREEFLRGLSRSEVVSVDVGHAVHPNYPERYEPSHLIHLNHGPAIKVNSAQRYATDAETSARFASACRRADVPVQWYSHRGDLTCGSTIGPHLAASLGVPTVDIGLPALAMHSTRELAGSEDPYHLVRALVAYCQTV